MVRARLHIICGNCGANDGWEEAKFSVDFDGETLHNDVSFTCHNCHTNHDLSSYMDVVVGNIDELEAQDEASS